MNKTLDTLLSGRDNNFDFIRFCAALTVIFSHSYNLAANTVDPLSTLSGDLTNLGALSVSIFFVISGMLIAQSFHRTSSFTNFVEARILRIYPALILTILVTVFIIGPLMTNLSIQSYFTDIGTLKYLTNMSAVRIQYFLPGVFETNPYPNAVNGSLWTLPLEIGCYASVAASFLLWNKRYFQSILIALFILFIFGRTMININTFYFALGVIAYVYRNRIKMNKYMALFSLIGFGAVLMLKMNLILAYLILGLTTAYLTLFVGFVKTTSIKNFAQHGDFSYGIYIWAFPIQQIIAAKLPMLSLFNHFLLSSFITLILSIASWHLIEKQALKFKKQLNYQSNSFYRFTSRFAIRMDKLILNDEVKTK